MAVPYQKLRSPELSFDDNLETLHHHYYTQGVAPLQLSRSRIWSRLKRVPIRRRLKVRLPALRRFLRKKARLVAAVRLSWARVLKRLKESQDHFGDLFAGNYLFLQVNPTPAKKYIERASAAGVYGLSSSKFSAVPVISANPPRSSSVA